MTTDIETVVVLTHSEDVDRIAIPAELLPEDYRTDGELRLVAALDRLNLLREV